MRPAPSFVQPLPDGIHAIDTGQGQPYLDEVMTVVRRALGRRSARPSGPRA